VINLEPNERYKCRLLDSPVVSERLGEYYRAQGYATIVVRSSPTTEVQNKIWRTKPPEKVVVRLKRLYEIELRDSDGNPEVRHVLAKSVGTGWLSYHAFLIAERLSDFVPPTLGLLDGILYTEWFPQTNSYRDFEADRSALAGNLGAYVGTRARELMLRDDPTATLAEEGRHNGFQMLAYSLSRAYNSRLEHESHSKGIYSVNSHASPFRAAR